MEALCRRDVRRDAVRSRSGALVFGALADLAAVTVMGGERQVGVEVSLTEVEGLVGVFEDLEEEEEEESLKRFLFCFSCSSSLSESRVLQLVKPSETKM